jgi:5-formyltetrahydrofolate cyclo-ligase
MKTILRKQMRQHRRTLTVEQRQIESAKIMSLLETQTCFQKARIILGYASLYDEVETMSLIKKWCHEKTFLLPVVSGDDLKLVRYEGEQSLIKSKWGILEPQGEVFTDYTQIDLALIPGLAFDLQGGRMGYGKGFYDRLLSKSSFNQVLTCGLAFSCQLVPHVQMEQWDVPLKSLLTSETFYYFQN